MPTVSLALMWHQHQPYYPDDVAGENPMPWVRLHATKDYLGMALHLEEVPEFRCTINLVPSLLVQIDAYVHGATDRHLDVSRLPASSLGRADALYLLDHFFMAHADSMSRMHPLLFEKDDELAEFRAKGARYTEDEKQWLLAKQRDLLARIIPMHRKLAEGGQVELTTTPFFHPILPLLFDKRLAREAMPHVDLPSYRDGYPED